MIAYTQDQNEAFYHCPLNLTYPVDAGAFTTHGDILLGFIDHRQLTRTQLEAKAGAGARASTSRSEPQNEVAHPNDPET